MRLFHGNILFTKDKNSFTSYENSYILEDKGKILDIGKNLPSEYPNVEVIDYANKLLIPGFVDLHFHAVQYGNLGLGLDEHLLDWLKNYTFKEEEKFIDNAYAKNIFERALNHIIDAGTTRAVLYSSIHQEASELLMNLCEDKKLISYVGKVNMDRNSSVALTENTQSSIAITEQLLHKNYRYVKSIITPRFVPSCSIELMNGLGKLASKGYPVQTHLSETMNEIEWVKSLHPTSKNYLDVYDQVGLINDKTILAHCIFCSKEERDTIKARNAFVAHCPSANFNLSSGIMNSKLYLDEGINIGLGTDVGAGNAVAIKDIIVEAIKMSKVSTMYHDDEQALSLSEAFYLATKGGGKYFGQVGSFEVDYDFDLLVIDPFEASENYTLIEQLQQFLYAGNTHQILASYCKGNLLKKSKS